MADVAVESRTSHTETHGGTITSFSFSVDCGTASDRFLWFSIGNEGGNFGLPSSITYNSVAMVNILSHGGGGVSGWALGRTGTLPASGSNTLEVTYSPGGTNAEGINCVAVCLSNVDLGASESDAVRSTATDDSGTSYSETLTTEIGDYILGFGADWQDNAHTPTGSAVERFELDASPTAQKQTGHFCDFIATGISTTFGASDFQFVGAHVAVIKVKPAGVSIPRSLLTPKRRLYMPKNVLVGLDGLPLGGMHEHRH